MAIASESGGFSGLPVVGKILILVVMLALISGIFYGAALRPLHNDIDDATAQHDRLVSDVSVARDRQEQFHVLTQEVTQRQALDRHNKRVLPEQSEIAAFLQDLDHLAELSGLEIHLVEPRPEEPHELYVRIPVNLRISGRYHQVAKFFYNVSRLDRAINMENVHLREPAQQGEDVALQVNVLATTFRRPDENPAAGGVVVQPGGGR
jgi:type IV pilus assembly protein PilO